VFSEDFHDPDGEFWIKFSGEGGGSFFAGDFYPCPKNDKPDPDQEKIRESSMHEFGHMFAIWAMGGKR
jgi:hypothetical protein